MAFIGVRSFKSYRMYCTYLYLHNVFRHFVYSIAFFIPVLVEKPRKVLAPFAPIKLQYLLY